MKIRLFGLGISVFILIAPAHCQIVIDKDTPVGSTSNTQISFTGNKTNNSSVADPSKAILLLTGSNQSLINGRGTAIVLGGIVVDGGGTKTLIGVWEVADPLTFNNGVVIPSGSASKIVHTIAIGSAGHVVVNNPLSFVNGIFNSKGTPCCAKARR